MALTCPNCGAQNSDTNHFCQNCGSELAVQGSAAVMKFAQPLALRRLPMGLVVIAVVAMVMLMSGVAIVVAAVAKETGTKSPPSSQPAFAPGPAPSPIPPPSLGPSPSVKPSPIASPSAQPSPIPSPTKGPPPGPPSAVPSPSSPPKPSPTVPPAGQGTVCNSSLCLTPPSGWLVATRDDNSLVLTNNNPAGVAGFQTTTFASAVTSTGVLQMLVDNLKRQYPDVTVCQQPQDAQVGDRQGKYVYVCFTLIAQGGQATKVEELLWAGLNTNGTIAYVSDGLAAVADIDNFVTARLVPLMRTVQWKT